MLTGAAGGAGQPCCQLPVRRELSQGIPFPEGHVQGCQRSRGVGGSGRSTPWLLSPPAAFEAVAAAQL